jgi:hypothetical protein
MPFAIGFWITWGKDRMAHGVQETAVKEIMSTQPLNLKTLQVDTCPERERQEGRRAGCPEKLAKTRAKNLAVRLKLAVATAVSHENFTKTFLGNCLLNAVVNQTTPVGATHALDVLMRHREIGLKGAHTVFHASDKRPEDLSNLFGLAKGTLHPGGELAHLQPWLNRLAWHQHSNQKVVFAWPTLLDALSFTANASKKHAVFVSFCQTTLITDCSNSFI